MIFPVSTNKPGELLPLALNLWVLIPDPDEQVGLEGPGQRVVHVLPQSLGFGSSLGAKKFNIVQLISLGKKPLGLMLGFDYQRQLTSRAQGSRL